MENASKAFIIAAEVLLGALLLTLIVFLFGAAGNFSNTVDKNIETKNINEFNAKFERYHKRKNLTAQDVITIANLAKEYNKKIGSTEIAVTVLNVESKYRNAHQLENQFTYDFIEQYSYQSSTKDITYFECQSIEYNDATRKVKQIVIKKL